MMDNEEAVQHVERQRRHRKEVAGGNHVAVVAEEGHPPLDLVGVWSPSRHVPGYGPLRHLEAELEQLAVDFRGSPRDVLDRHPADQLSDFLMGTWPPCPSWPRLPAPVELEALAVPLHDGLRLHDDQGVDPMLPGLLKGDPERSVHSREWRSWALLFEDRNLLSQSEILQSEVGSRPEQGADHLHE
jgi:hypothetical protein